LQFTTLCSKGYHLIAVQPPYYSTHREWIRGLDKFLDFIKFPKVHLFGEGLGGYLLQCFAIFRPKRVESMMMCNSFISTNFFSQNSPISGIYKYLPEIILKKYVLSYFPTKALPVNIIDSIDFLVEKVESLKRKLLASRITLNTTTGPLEVQNFPIEPSKMTIIDAMDETFFVPQNLREELCTTYPSARQAKIKDGGDFPFISVANEINNIIEEHLKACGYEFISTLDEMNLYNENNNNPIGENDNPLIENVGNEEESSGKEKDNENPIIKNVENEDEGSGKDNETNL